MATMIRVKMDAPTSGATVTAGAATWGVCLADELAIVVGTGIPPQRLGSEFRELLKLLASKSRTTGVAAGSVLALVGTPGQSLDAIEADGFVNVNATPVDETKWGLMVGATAANKLATTDVVRAAVLRAIDAFVSTFGL